MVEITDSLLSIFGKQPQAKSTDQQTQPQQPSQPVDDKRQRILSIFKEQPSQAAPAAPTAPPEPVSKAVTPAEPVPVQPGMSSPVPIAKPQPTAPVDIEQPTRKVPSTTTATTTTTAEGYRPLEGKERRYNADGSFSTEITASEYGPDGKIVTFPTLWMKDGNIVELPVEEALKQALAYEESTGKRFPRHDTPGEANIAARIRSDKGGIGVGPLAEPPKMSRLQSASGAFAQSFGHGVSDLLRGYELSKRSSLLKRAVDGLQLETFVERTSQTVDDIKVQLAEVASDPNRSPEWKAKQTSLLQQRLEAQESLLEEQKSLLRKELLKRQQLLERFNKLPPLNMSDAGVIAEAIDNTIKEFAPSDPRFEKELFQQLASGAGSVAGIAPSILVGTINPTVGVIMAGTQGMAMESAAMYEDAISHGADERTALKAADLGFLIGTTDILPLFKMLEKYENVSPGIRGRVVRTLKRMTVSGITEGMQEGLQTALENVVARVGLSYDPDRPWDAGVLESIIVGGIIGHGFGLGAAAIIRPEGLKKGEEEPTAEFTPSDVNEEFTKAITPIEPHVAVNAPPPVAPGSLHPLALTPEPSSLTAPPAPTQPPNVPISVDGGPTTTTLPGSEPSVVDPAAPTPPPEPTTITGKIKASTPVEPVVDTSESLEVADDGYMPGVLVTGNFINDGQDWQIVTNNVPAYAIAALGEGETGKPGTFYRLTPEQYKGADTSALLEQELAKTGYQEVPVIDNVTDDRLRWIEGVTEEQKAEALQLVNEALKLNYDNWHAALTDQKIGFDPSAGLSLYRQALALGLRLKPSKGGGGYMVFKPDMFNLETQPHINVDSAASPMLLQNYKNEQYTFTKVDEDSTHKLIGSPLPEDPFVTTSLLGKRAIEKILDSLPGRKNKPKLEKSNFYSPGKSALKLVINSADIPNEAFSIVDGSVNHSLISALLMKVTNGQGVPGVRPNKFLEYSLRDILEDRTATYARSFDVLSQALRYGFENGYIFPLNKKGEHVKSFDAKKEADKLASKVIDSIFDKNGKAVINAFEAVNSKLGRLGLFEYDFKIADDAILDTTYTNSKGEIKSVFNEWNRDWKKYSILRGNIKQFLQPTAGAASYPQSRNPNLGGTENNYIYTTLKKGETTSKKTGKAIPSWYTAKKGEKLTAEELIDRGWDDAKAFNNNRPLVVVHKTLLKAITQLSDFEKKAFRKFLEDFDVLLNGWHKEFNLQKEKLVLAFGTELGFARGMFQYSTENDVTYLFIDKKTILDTLKKMKAFHEKPKDKSASTTSAAGIVSAAVTDFFDLQNSRAEFDLYTTVAHEYGHFLQIYVLRNTSLAHLKALHEAYNRYLVRGSLPIEYGGFLSGFGLTRGESPLRRAGFESQKDARKPFFAASDITDLDYTYSFNEFLAEQFVKYVQKSAYDGQVQKPLTKLEQVMAKLANMMHTVYKTIMDKITTEGKQHLLGPTEEYLNYLDALRKGEHNKDQPFKLTGRLFGDTVLNVTQQAANNPQLTQEGVVTQPDAAGHMLQNLQGLAEKVNAPPQVKKNLKWLQDYRDVYNRILRYALSIQQMARLNKHIPWLQTYVQMVEQWYVSKTKWLSRAEGTVRDWSRLPIKQQVALADFLFDIDNMVYLSNEERLKGPKAFRQPTVDELNTLAKKHNLDEQGKQLYLKIKGDFDAVLNEMERIRIEDIKRSFDPTDAGVEFPLGEAKMEFAALRRRPYFPHSRFGNIAVVVKSKKGKTVYMELFETQRDATRAMNQLLKDYPSQGPDADYNRPVKLTVPREARQFAGMPPQMLASLKKHLEILGGEKGLNDKQKEWLNNFAVQMTPTRSFKRRLAHRYNIEGYSRDALRAYADYFWHASNYLARVEWGVQMGLVIDNAKKSLTGTRPEDLAGVTPTATFDTGAGVDVEKRGKILQMMEAHHGDIMNPRPDWAGLRAAAFMMHLGFVPAAAALNLTQIPIVGWPYLTARFNHLQGSTALTASALRNAGRNVTRLWYTPEQVLSKMSPTKEKLFSEAVAQNFVNESMAAELAGIAGGGLLHRTRHGSRIMRGAVAVSNAASYMFQASENYNRRVMFDATTDMALKHGVSEQYKQYLLNRYDLNYRDLLERGWTQKEALAFIAGKDVVQTTQYEYSSHARPEFMSGGPRGLVFTFYMFTQNTVFNMFTMTGNTKMLFMMMALGGLMGLPGATDMFNVLQWAARNAFGQQFDLEDEVRALLNELLGGDDEHDDAAARLSDLVLHGVSREGFGLAAAGDALGLPIPMIDMSANVSMGEIIPGLNNIGDAPRPGESFNQQWVDSTTDAAGASIGVGINLLKALSSDLPFDDLKRWEKAMPRAMRNVSRAARYLSEGRERTNSGATVAEYNKDDPEQMAEILAQAAGFASTRLNRRWDKEAALRDVTNFWQMHRTNLLREFDRAVEAKDPDLKKDARTAIKKFNNSVPFGELRITSDDIRRSRQARERSRARFEQERSPYNRYTRVGRRIGELYGD